MFLYPKGHKIYQGHLEPFNDSDLKKLRAKIEDILNGEKYLKMAELTGIC
jgi:hypothetical protein